MRTIVGTLLAVLFASAALAQDTTDIQLTRAEIQKARQEIVAAGMKLTEDEALAFWPAYRDYRVDMARVGDRLVKLITEFAASNATLNDEQAKRMLDEMLDIDGDLLAVRKKHAGSFGKLLPAPKVARFFQIENKLDAIVRAELAAAIPLAR